MNINKKMYGDLNVSDDDNLSSLSMVEVANYLKEADCYDASQTDQEMLQLYKVLNDSKSTASAEDEQRRILKDTDRNCQTIDEMRQHSVPVNGEDDVDDCESLPSSTSTDVQDASFKTDTTAKTDTKAKTEIGQKLDDFDEIDVFNSVPTKHPPLPQITYEPKYNPPLYCNTNIVNLSLPEKKRIIFEYHKKLVKIYDSHQRRSPYYAPLGKPILPDVKFNGSLLKTKEKSTSYDFEDSEICEQDNNSNDIYVTKTGRQTKRKLYTENKDDEKKFKSSPSAYNSPTGSQTKKRNINVCSMKNEDIMKRSKLFSTKAEKMYDKLNEKKEKDEQEEKENAKFMSSLRCDSDDEFLDDPSEIAKIVHSDEMVTTRRRITPPLRGKKAGRGNKSKVPMKNISAKKETTNLCDSLDCIPSSQPTVKDNGTCPICNLEFPQNKLESHADQCIDNYEKKSYMSSKDHHNQMVCEYCDTVLPLTMDYEIHVRECLTKSKPMTISP